MLIDNLPLLFSLFRYRTSLTRSWTRQVRQVVVVICSIYLIKVGCLMEDRWISHDHDMFPCPFDLHLEAARIKVFFFKKNRSRGARIARSEYVLYISVPASRVIIIVCSTTGSKIDSQVVGLDIDTRSDFVIEYAGLNDQRSRVIELQEAVKKMFGLRVRKKELQKQKYGVRIGITTYSTVF